LCISCKFDTHDCSDDVMLALNDRQ
jgi:hypothetical protein